MTWGDQDYGELPEAARPKVTISADGRQHILEHTFHLKPGQIFPTFQADDGLFIMYPYPMHEWGLAADDPTGEWKIEAFVNDKPVVEAIFFVRE